MRVIHVASKQESQACYRPTVMLVPISGVISRQINMPNKVQQFAGTTTTALLAAIVMDRGCPALNNEHSKDKNTKL